MQTQDPRVVVALDFDKQQQALNLVEQLDPTLCKLKVGKEMFTYFGPDFVRKLVAKEFDVFLDLKFHDIPNTVAKACKAAADLGVWMVNVHASGGPKMMEHAQQALVNYGSDKPKLIAVTVLTSMDQQQLSATNIACSPQEQVLHLAHLTKQSGLDGVVCSAQEAKMLRQDLGKEFLLVTPGIRPADAAKGDQIRVVTPTNAVELGASYLVIGRPITQANDPLSALRAINQDITSVN